MIEFIQGVEHEYANQHVDTLWNLVRDAPRKLAAQQDEFILQMIDEFQFLNTMIYRDKGKQNLSESLFGSYFGTAESKIAPLLVSFNRPRIAELDGWLGWRMKKRVIRPPWRSQYRCLENMPEVEVT